MRALQTRRWDRGRNLNSGTNNGNVGATVGNVYGPYGAVAWKLSQPSPVQARFFAYTDTIELTFEFQTDAVMTSPVSFNRTSTETVTVELRCYDDADTLIETQSAVLGPSSWRLDSVAACSFSGVSRAELVAVSGSLVLDNVKFTYNEIPAVIPTPVPSATPYGVADFTCEYPIVGDSDPVFDLTVVKKMGQTCFTIIPAFKTDNYDSGVLGFVLGVFNIDIPVVKFPGFKLCVDWYQTPGLWFFGTYISIDAIIAVIVGSWLLRRLMA